ncbi:hypothetical protein GGS21DRAFT_468232 [Xylaria nigripes]|nr:hypothetical protein GGS21DRAFT_468232 [Xylaria nigripes]
MYIYNRDLVPEGHQGDEHTAEQQEVFPISYATTLTPIGPTSYAKHHYNHFLAWILRTFSVLIFTGTSPSSSNALPSLNKRSIDPSTTTSIVAGVLVSAFVIGVGVFFYFYGRSIQVRRMRHRHHHRHRRQVSGTEKISQVSEVAGGGAGADAGTGVGAGAGEEGEPAPQS